jgi:hypothetical protein
VWVWASCSRLIQVFCGRIFSLTTLAERPPGGVAGSQEHACTHSLLTMLTRGKLAVMLLALSSVALSSVAVTSTATNDSSEGKRRMWANACTNMACVCYHMQPIHGHLGVFST